MSRQFAFHAVAAVRWAVMPSVLALGLDPKFADYTKMPGLSVEMVRAFIEAQLGRIREAGYDVQSCLTDLGDTAEAVTLGYLRRRSFDCVLIGAGLSDASNLLLFERLLNLVHAHAPGAKICFNSSPADSLEAVQRWVPTS